MRVYHGSPKKFDTLKGFITPGSQQRNVMCFTPIRDLACSYSRVLGLEGSPVVVAEKEECQVYFMPTVLTPSDHSYLYTFDVDRDSICKFVTGTSGMPMEVRIMEKDCLKLKPLMIEEINRTDATMNVIRICSNMLIHKDGKGIIYYCGEIRDDMEMPILDAEYSTNMTYICIAAIANILGLRYLNDNLDIFSSECEAILSNDSRRSGILLKLKELHPYIENKLTPFIKILYGKNEDKRYAQYMSLVERYDVDLLSAVFECCRIGVLQNIDNAGYA